MASSNEKMSNSCQQQAESSQQPLASSQQQQPECSQQPQGQAALLLHDIGT